MKKVLVLVAPGFEEIETITVVDILRRAGARVTMAGLADGPVEGSRGIKILPDGALPQGQGEEFDLVVVPGGLGGTQCLQQEPRVLSLLDQMNSAQKLVAAICAAPLVLQSAQIIGCRKITSHPSVQEKLADVNYCEDRVVVDGNLITSRGPGTAMEFALKLVEILFGRERVDTVNKGVLAKV